MTISELCPETLYALGINSIGRFSLFNQASKTLDSFRRVFPLTGNFRDPQSKKMIPGELAHPLTLDEVIDAVILKAEAQICRIAGMIGSKMQ